MNCNKTNYIKDETSFSTFDTVEHNLKFCNANENGAIKSSNYNQNYPVHKLPEKYRHIFSNFKYFNKIQSQAIDILLYTDKSLVVSLPTGSEKKVIFEFSIVCFLEKFPNCVENSKIIYVSSIKATCSEHYKDWKNKFSNHGLKCTEVTGDTDFSKDMHLINNNQLIITTLEKWDSLMRKCKDIKYTLGTVKLFLIDEVHLINEVDQGATLETIVSRMKIIPKHTNMNDFTLRFVAVSTTVSNIEDLAEWLCIDQNNPACYLKSNEDERPVKLKKIVLDYKCITSSFKFDLDLTHKLKSLIRQYSNGQSTLIFCGTQKSVEYTCSILVKDTKIIELCEDKQRHINEISKEIYNKTIKDLLQHGIGCLYAGMTIQERICIENLFQVGCLNILVATSTLAMKVNILAQLIIIKSTEYYTFNCYKEYNECQVLQMIGRAGRPQVDTSATAIIMTKQSTKDQYKQILTGNRFLESHLHKNLIEHLNTEIFMGTINNVTVAMDWMQSTFLYIRACKSPQNYGMIKTLNVNEVEHKLQNLCLTSIKSLACTGLINCFDGNNKIISKPEGEIMNKYSISFATMNLYMQLKGTESLRDMLRILTCSKEFEHIKFRRTDKENLNSLNKNQQSRSNIIRFPIDEGINTRETKINCLLQAILGSLKISNGLLAQDAHTIILISIRLTKALKEIAFRGTMFESARSACILAKCIITKLWEQSEYVSKLIPRVGLVLSGLLVSNGKTTLESISDTDPRELERILKRNAPFGNHILDFITQIPKYKVRVSFDKYIKLLILKISLMDYSNISKTIRSHTISILVGDSENCLLKAHQICNEDFLKQEGVIDMTVLLKNECFFHIPDYTVTVCLISDQWIGIDIEIKLNLDNSKEYIKESTNAEHKKSTEHYKKMEQISINENEKKKCTTQMNIKKYVCNVFSKDQDQDLKVINKLHMEENNKKKNHANKSRDATHNVTGKMKIGMKTKNNNNGKLNYCFKSNKDNLNKYFSYNELMNDNIFCDLFLPDDNSCIISETFDLAEKCCFRENAMQTEYWTNNTQIKVVDPIQLQCSRNALPNEKLENNKFINLDKYNKIAHKKNSLCFNDLLLENKENVNPNKLERLKKRSLRILSSKLFGKPSTQTIHKSEVKSNHSINDSKMSNHNVSSKSVLPKEKLSVNAVIDGKSSKTATQFEASRDFLVTKFESSTLNIIAPTSGSTSNLTSGHLTRQIEANLKVTSDFYASHKQFSEFANDSGSSSCGENVLKFVCDYSYEQTKPDAVGPFTEASGLIAYHHCPSDKVTLDKFFRASKYLRRFKAPNTDKLDSTYDSMKSWMCGDGEKRSSNAVKRIKFMHEPLETSFEDVHKLFAHRFTNRNEYNKDDSEVSSVATITARQYLRYDLPTSTS